MSPFLILPSSSASLKAIPIEAAVVFPYLWMFENILSSEKNATENIFSKKKIPYRSFYILKKDEEQLGVLFTFFVLETILLSKFLKVNPFDQPAVENIKKTTKNILLKI